MPRPMWFVNLIKKGFPHRFFFSKFTKVPLIGRILDYMMFHEDDIIYLPKDTAIKVNQPIERHGDMILPSVVVDHFIDEANYLWVMDWCICRSSSKCDSYPTNFGCLFLGEAAIDIDPRLGRQVTRQEAHEHVKKCREAGLVHLIGRNKLDTVWLKVGPSKKLLTICNCCECCCLWRILPHVSQKISNKVTKLPGVSVQVGEECLLCGICTEGICFVNAVSLGENRAEISDLCRGCGRCVEVCPQGAISLTIKDPESILSSINKIESLVDIT
ncbi:MAG: 4Fe-4S ferredoxin [Candidatus Heimdallarchaeota archaeon]|nr:4Fe-4S ferredoxin [Candidatus Heimdallarchaeota archaeon]